MFVSCLCLAHCLLTPALLALGGFGVLGALLEDRLVHLAVLLPVLLLALTSFPGACRRYRRPAVMVAGFSGLLLLAGRALPGGNLGPAGQRRRCRFAGGFPLGEPAPAVPPADCGLGDGK
nr:MerC family mercury resistance protein [Microbulbifer rhizosphaerae]